MPLRTDTRTTQTNETSTRGDRSDSRSRRTQAVLTSPGTEEQNAILHDEALLTVLEEPLQTQTRGRRSRR